MTTQPTKPCKCGCGAVIRKLAGETPYRFHRRQYATPKCFYQKRKIKLPTRRCACGCGSKLIQRDNEKISGFRKRKFASLECLHRSNIKELPVKHCEGCGAKHERRVLANGKPEKPHAFLSRRFCGKSCAGRAIAIEQHRKSPRRRKTPPKPKQAKPKTKTVPKPAQALTRPLEPRPLPNPVRQTFVVSAPEPVETKNGVCECGRPLNAWKVCGYCAQRREWVDGQKAKLGQSRVWYGS